MLSPKSIKEVQKLNSQITSLSRFISKASEHCISFFRALKGNKKFEWTGECEKAFQRLKAYFSSPPILSQSKDEEPLLLYLSVLDHAVSSVFVRTEGKE